MAGPQNIRQRRKFCYCWTSFTIDNLYKSLVQNKSRELSITRNKFCRYKNADSFILHWTRKLLCQLFHIPENEFYFPCLTMSKKHTSGYTLLLSSRNAPSHHVPNYNIRTNIQPKYLLKIQDELFFKLNIEGEETRGRCTNLKCRKQTLTI